MSEDENCTFTVLRTSDAAKKTITVSLGTKLNDLKATLANEFDVPSDQRLFYMGRELKSGGRSLSKLGLGKLVTNVLHMHIPPTSTKAADATTQRKRRRKEIPTPEPRQARQRASQSQSATSNSVLGGDVIEIIDDSDDDEVQVL